MGIVLGLLYAPARGEQTRRDLRERLEESVAAGRRKWGQVLEAGREQAGEIGRRAGERAFDKLTEQIRPEERTA